MLESGYQHVEDIYSADFVITYFTSMSLMEDHYFGEDNFLDKLMDEALILDFSSITPNFADEINSIVTLSNKKMVIAPMLVKNQVSEEAFSKNNLSCFAYGENDALEAAKPILDSVFNDIKIVNSPGIAQLMHAANALQKTSEVVSAIESTALFSAARKGITNIGMDEYLPEATSPEAFFVLRAISEDRYDSDYTVEMLMGELNAAIMSADDYDMIIPQAEAAFHLLELLAIIGGADKSPAALALVYGDIDKDKCSQYGLDWSKAEELYPEHDEGYDQYPGFDNFDDLDDDLIEDEFNGFGYSSN